MFETRKYVITRAKQIVCKETPKKKKIDEIIKDKTIVVQSLVSAHCKKIQEGTSIPREARSVPSEDFSGSGNQVGLVTSF